MHSTDSVHHTDPRWKVSRAIVARGAVDQVLRLKGYRFHSDPCDRPQILSSFDAGYSRGPLTARCAVERALIEEFVSRAFPAFPPDARKHIDPARCKWGSHFNTGSLFVGRHYGLPVRGVDWTTCPLTALFFACRRNPRSDGVIWWMNGAECDELVAAQWPTAYGKKCDIEDDLEADFQKQHSRDILTCLHFPSWLTQARQQEAFLTFSLRLGEDHALKLSDLGLRSCGRLRLSHTMKSDIIAMLEAEGINAESLGLTPNPFESMIREIQHAIMGT